MNLGPYYRVPQAVQGVLSNSYQYGELPNPTSGEQSSTLRDHNSFDGLPRVQTEQHQQQKHFMTSLTGSTSNVLPDYSVMNPISMAMPQPQMWDDQMQIGGFEDHSANSYYGYSSPFAVGNNDNFTRGVELGIPRFMPNEMNSNSYNDNMLDAYEPSSYLAEPSRSGYHHGLDRFNMSYNPGLETSHEFSRLSISRSPHPKIEEDLCGDPLQFERAPNYRLASSEASDEGGLSGIFTPNSSRETTTAIDDGEQATEEPYAKLIHRALMSTPNHSMVLQEIYQWFRENTTKGSLNEGKGWMNSIRHNLSMNAAFKKTERKIQGDETKKSTEWVLEDFAVRDGVQSTTRYRKGTNAKKFLRNDHPAAARQVSGRKGGVATSAIKNGFSRRRSKDDLRESRRTASHRISNGRRSGLEHTMTRSHAVSRQRSPLTPTDTDRHLARNYFLNRLQDPLEISTYDPDHFTLNDVQGVYLEGPLFSDNPRHDGPHFHHAGPSLTSQRF